MEETSQQVNKKRISTSSLETLNSGDSPRVLDETHCMDIPSDKIGDVYPQPPYKKAKYSSPRPLRILKPSSAHIHSSLSNISSHSDVSLAHTSGSLSTPQRTEKSINKSSSPSTVVTVSSSSLSESTWDCRYCNRSIEGGEAGKRRHQAGEKHLSRVLRGIVKYIAPSVFPALEFKFPSSISFSIQKREFLTYIEDQQLQFNRFVRFLADPNSVSDQELPKSTSLDIDLLILLMICKPSNVSRNFSNIGDVYRALCQLKIRLPVAQESLECAFCEERSTFSVATSSKPEPTISSALSALSEPSESPSVVTERMWLDFWRHLASESHRKVVEKFWREHRIRPLSAPKPANSSSLRATDALLKADGLEMHSKYADSSNFMLSQAQLQQKLEEWAKLAQLISMVPNLGTLDGVRGQEAETMELSEPRVMSTWIDAPNPFENINQSIKDKIYKFMKLGEAKKGERVGSKWADAVKAFLTNAGLTLTQLRQLSRLERIANPSSRRSQWLPNFGGVWNETSRADHARAYIASERRGKDM